MKKILALLLSFCMVFGFGVIGNASTSIDANYTEAEKVLKSLNIMVGDEQGNFNPDKTVTRAEMAKILCAITGSGELAPVNCGFADVPSNHWASGYISVAKNNGWIKGYGDGNFGPNDIVLYEQAIKMVMSALNYGVYADEQGGYPYGWLMAAGEAEVTRAGATGAVGEECSRAKIAMIIYYALEANMMKQTAFGDQKWEIIEGQTLLTKYLDTYKVEGEVIDSYKYAGTSLEEDEISYAISKICGLSANNYKAIELLDKIGATDAVITKLNAKGTNAADLYGYTTVGYIHVDEDGKASLVAIAEKGNKNTTVEITNLENIYDESKDNSERDIRKPELIDANNYRFSYWKNDRDLDTAITALKLDSDVKVVINKTNAIPMSAVDGGTTNAKLKKLVPDNGVIKLTDVNSDGYYDLIEVTSYEVAVVDYVNVSKNKIILKDTTLDNNSISLDKEEQTQLTDINISFNEKSIDLSALKENDILTISTNSDNTYYDIIVTRDVVEGKVSGIKGDIAYIGNKAYKGVNGLLECGKGADIDINAEGLFYLDAQGKIAYVDIVTIASDDYAIVDKFAVNSMDEVSIRMLTYEGITVTAPVADKVKINGIRVNLKDAVGDLSDMNLSGISGTTYYDVLKNIFDGNDDVVTGVSELNKIITFGMSNNEVNEINFAVGSGAGEFGYVGTRNAEWQADNNRFKSSKTLADNAVIVCMEGTVFSDWKFTTAKSLIDGTTYSPYFLALQKDGTIGLVVLTTLPSTLNQDASLAIFTDYRTGVYGEEEIDVAYVTYIVDGEVATEALPVDKTKFDEANLVIGDTFLYVKNNDGIVDTINTVFSPKLEAPEAILDITNLDEFMIWNTDNNEDNEVYFGTLIKAAEDKLTVAPYQDTNAIILGSTIEIINVPSTAKVYAYKAYNTDAKKLTICDSIVDLDASAIRNNTGDYEVIEDANDLTYVFFRINNGIVTEVIGVDYNK